MNIINEDVSNAVQTEIKLYMTQLLHRKGLLSDKACDNAKELILKEASSNNPKNLSKKPLAGLQ